MMLRPQLISKFELKKEVSFKASLSSKNLRSKSPLSASSVSEQFPSSFRGVLSGNLLFSTCTPASSNSVNCLNLPQSNVWESMFVYEFPSTCCSSSFEALRNPHIPQLSLQT